MRPTVQIIAPSRSWPAVPVLHLLLLALTLTASAPAPVAGQFGPLLFGPPPASSPCRCVPASLCPAHLVRTAATFCAGQGLVCCLAAAASRGPLSAPELSGGGRSCGRPGQPDSGPVWTVAVTRRDPDGLLYRSAGALLSGTHVITAAHSVIAVPASQLVVVASMHDLLEDLGQEIFRRVAAVLVHPGYHPGDQKHNLAILRLETALEPSGGSAVAPVCLSLPAAPPVDPEGACWASGWGRDVASHDATAAPLTDVRVGFVSSGECLDSLADHGQTIDLAADLCLRPRRAEDSMCQLDAGSPVVCRAADGSATLVGVVSWARRCAGRRRMPMVVAAAIAPHLDWIAAVLEA